MKKNISNEANEANTNSTVTLGEIISNGTGNMPVIEVLLNGECTGYLSPFRAYSFQVSRTADGQWDMASSPVVGLRNVLEANAPDTRGSGYQSNLDWYGEAQACLLKGLALQALVSYSSHMDAVLDLGKHSFESFVNESGEAHSKYYQDRLAKFISIVVEYLKEV